jgi:hypothetical protein
MALGCPLFGDCCLPWGSYLTRDVLPHHTRSGLKWYKVSSRFPLCEMSLWLNSCVIRLRLTSVPYLPPPVSLTPPLRALLTLINKMLWRSYCCSVLSLYSQGSWPNASNSFLNLFTNLTFNSTGILDFPLGCVYVCTWVSPGQFCLG